MTNGKSDGISKIVLAAIRAKAEQGLTRQEAADELGVSYATISKYVHGHGITFKGRVYKNEPFKTKSGSFQIAVRIDASTWALLAEETKKCGLSAGVVARILISEALSSSENAA